MRPVTGLAYGIALKLYILAIVKADAVRTSVILFTDSVKAVHSVYDRVPASYNFDIFGFDNIGTNVVKL